MIRSNIPLLLLLLLFIPKIFGNDGALPNINKYEYSKIIEVPDLSFVGTVFSGLDILEQMDFKPLRNKTIAILTNQLQVLGFLILDYFPKLGSIG